jgi:hypothetical protein
VENAAATRSLNTNRCSYKEVVEMPENGPKARGDEDEVAELDYELAEEIARFVAARAFLFEDQECRAWALTDFETWASLAGCEAELSLISRRRGAGEPAG